MCRQQKNIVKPVKGDFGTISRKKLERVTIGLSNNCKKLYLNLLELCEEDGELMEKQLTQAYLLELMGMSETYTKILKVATDTLIQQKLIKVRREWKVEVEEKDGLPVVTTPKEILYYSIVVE